MAGPEYKDDYRNDFKNGAMFGKSDLGERLVRELLGRGMQEKIDTDLLASLMDTFDGKDVLTYQMLKEMQKNLKSPYDTYGTSGDRVHLNPKEYPVLAPFMKMPSISKHINIVIGPSIDDPYGIQIKIEYKLPEYELVEYRKSLYDFIMNFISDKSLNDKEIDVFEKMSNDLAPQPTTLDDIQDILYKI